LLVCLVYRLSVCLFDCLIVVFVGLFVCFVKLSVSVFVCFFYFSVSLFASWFNYLIVSVLVSFVSACLSV
jgi:hypothetical protein